MITSSDAEGLLVGLLPAATEIDDALVDAGLAGAAADDDAPEDEGCVEPNADKIRFPIEEKKPEFIDCIACLAIDEKITNNTRLI